MSAPNELERIASARSGDRDAYAELVRAYQGKVVGLCFSYLKDISAAEDAAQDVFIKAHGALSHYRGESAFGTWLYRIGANHCKDLLRQNQRRKTDSLDQMMEQKNFDLPDAASAEESALENRDLAERLLAGLNDDQRQILSLRELVGLSYEEIGAFLGISLDAVKSRLKRAREEALNLSRHFLKSRGV